MTIICRKVSIDDDDDDNNNNNMKNLQIHLNSLGEWTFKNEMIINPTKSKVICFMKALVTEPLYYSLRNMVIPEVSSCKDLGIILRSDLSWAA
jgi:hypothetical protein